MFPGSLTYFHHSCTGFVWKCYHVAPGYWSVGQIEIGSPQSCNSHTRPKSETQSATDCLSIGNNSANLSRGNFNINFCLPHRTYKVQRGKASTWKCYWTEWHSSCKWAKSNPDYYIKHRVISCLTALDLYNTWAECKLFWAPELTGIIFGLVCDLPKAQTKHHSVARRTAALPKNSEWVDNAAVVRTVLTLSLSPCSITLKQIICLAKQIGSYISHLIGQSLPQFCRIKWAKAHRNHRQINPIEEIL